VARPRRRRRAGGPGRLRGLLRDGLGITVPAAAQQEARDTARLLGGTRYRAFSPSDTCPDNNLVTSRGGAVRRLRGRLLPRRRARRGLLPVPFPGCEASFALPDGMAETMLEAWRNEIASVWPDLDEPTGSTGACSTPSCCGCGVHLVAAAADPAARHGGRAGRHPLPRISTTLAHYWARMAEAAQATGHDASADLGRAVAAALRQRHDDAPASLPVFPAFRSVT
jgi:hypothetical protein